MRGTQIGICRQAPVAFLIAHTHTQTGWAACGRVCPGYRLRLMNFRTSGMCVCVCVRAAYERRTFLCIIVRARTTGGREKRGVYAPVGALNVVDSAEYLYRYPICAFVNPGCNVRRTVVPYTHTTHARTHSGAEVWKSCVANGTIEPHEGKSACIYIHMYV